LGHEDRVPLIKALGVQDQNLVVERLVPAHRPGQDAVDAVVDRRDPRDIDGFAGVEALSRLSEIEVQALVDLLLVEHPKLAQEPGGIQVAARVLVERLQRGLDLLGAAPRPLALQLVRSGPRDLDVDLCRGASGHRSHILDNLHGLRDAATKRGGPGQGVDAELTGLFQLGGVDLVDLRAEAELGVAQGLHQVHGRAAEPAVGRALLENVHDAHVTARGIYPHTGEQALGELAPALEALRAKGLNSALIKDIPVFLGDLALQDGALLEHGVPQDDVLCHELLGGRQGLHAEEACDPGRDGQARCHPFGIGHTLDVRVRHREVAREDVRDSTEGHDRAVRCGLDHGRPHRRIERQPVLAVLGVADARQFVQEPEALVDEGVRRKHVLIYQIGALARHAPDECLRGRIGVDMLLVVPGCDEGALMVGKAPRPREPRLAVRIQGRS